MKALGRFLLVNTLAGAIILAALGVSGYSDFPWHGAEASSHAPILQGGPAHPVAAPVLGAELPAGHMQLGARVVPEPSSRLIMPGDIVDLTAEPGGPALISSVRVLSIDPPFSGEDERLYVTFSLGPKDATDLKKLRETQLLRLRLIAHGRRELAGSFATLPPAEVVVRRFEGDRWLHRIAR